MPARQLRERPLPDAKAPAPPAPCCPWCSGEGAIPDDDLGSVPCEACDGTGAGAWVAPAELALCPMHSQPRPGSRKAWYDPNRSRLRLKVGSKVTRFVLFEFPVSPGFGRGWRLVKVDEKGDPVEELQDGAMRPAIREFQCGPSGVTCSCQGTNYASNAKANQRAFDAGREVYASYGCAHADAMVALLRAGWFDIKQGGDQ